MANLVSHQSWGRPSAMFPEGLQHLALQAHGPRSGFLCPSKLGSCQPGCSFVGKLEEMGKSHEAGGGLWMSGSKAQPLCLPDVMFGLPGGGVTDDTQLLGAPCWLW